MHSVDVWLDPWGIRPLPQPGDILRSFDIYKNLDDLDIWDRLWKLIGMVCNWKGSIVEVEVEGAGKRTPQALQYEMDEVRACYGNRNASGLDFQYCSGKDAPNEESNCFGCRLISGVSRWLWKWHGKRDFYWYQYGIVSDDQLRFIVDKEQIFLTIVKETGSHLCTLCPAFDWLRVRSEIANLPDSVELGVSSCFQIRYSQVDKKPLGIEPREEFGDVPGTLQRHEVLSGRIDWHDEEQESSHFCNDEESIQRNVPTVRYSDVAGQDRALREIKDVVQLPLTHPEYFQNVGVQPQRGIILYGPPGNGKTLIAKAVATESDAHLEIISGPEVLSKWVGESEENLRQVFERARKLQPSVVLIDEIDAIASTRDFVSQQHEVSLISQLLVLLDGLEERGRVVVIATTNRIEVVDPAIRRPGRFDYHIEVPMPNEAGRKAILETFLQNLKTARELDASRIATVSRIAELSEGFSGADLAALCREAGLIAIKRGIATGIDAAVVAIGEPDLIAGFEAICQKRTSGSKGR